MATEIHRENIGYKELHSHNVVLDKITFSTGNIGYEIFSEEHVTGKIIGDIDEFSELENAEGLFSYMIIE